MLQLFIRFDKEIDYKKIFFAPSFTPGYYDEGDGKDLGHILNLSLKLILVIIFRKL